MMLAFSISSVGEHWVSHLRTSLFCRKKRMLRILFLIRTSEKSMQLKIMTITLMKEKPQDSIPSEVVS
jgi:hypothetical protein